MRASFTVSQLAPIITGVSPNPMPPLDANQTLMLTGDHYQVGATLTFVPPEGGTIQSTASKLTVNSSTQITYQFNNANDAGPWTVTVTFVLTEIWRPADGKQTSGV